MSLSFFGRKPVPAPVAPVLEPEPRVAPTKIQSQLVFDGLAEGYRLTGTMSLKGRLSDLLNRREELAISGVTRSDPLGVGEVEADPTYTRLDPYGFAIVFAGSDTLPDYSQEEYAAHKIRKLPYHVALKVTPYRVLGTIWLYAGTTAEELIAGRIKELFLPVTGAEVYLGEERIDSRGADSVLVNRFELRGVEDI